MLAPSRAGGRTMRVPRAKSNRAAFSLSPHSNPEATDLATGNQLWCRRDLRGAWTARDLASIGVADRVLVLGAPLSGADAVLSLYDQGHRGAIRLVSPRGLLQAVRAGIPPEVAERIGVLLAAGRLEVCAGDVTGAAAYGDTFVVDILPRGRTLHLSERYDWIVSCA